jgi:hypothetical protein
LGTNHLAKQGNQLTPNREVAIMGHMMTKSEGKAFLRRWRLVNTREIKDLRHTPLEVKLRQLAALMASVNQLGWTEALREGEAEVRDRWQRLRKAYGV